jgi:hypothetical protein
MCCTRNIWPEVAAIEREWDVGRRDPIEFEDADLWLSGTVVDAVKLMALRPVELYKARPATA